MIVHRKKCIFCENGKSFKSKEHVLPKWVLEELNCKNNVQPHVETQYNEIEYFSVDSKSKTHAEFNFDNFLSPYVCDGCNKGWMCKLEGQVKHILTPLIHGLKVLDDLSKNERLLIARWAVKTACVIESVNFSKSFYVSFNSRELKNSQTLPRGWAVFAFTHNATNTIGYFSSNVWFVEGTLTKELRKKIEHYKKVIFQLKNLVIATVYIGDENLELIVVKSTHFLIDVNLNHQWVSKPSSPSFTTYKGVVSNSSDDLMFRFLGAFSLRINKYVLDNQSLRTD